MLKSLHPTREAVSVLQAPCGSPYDVPDALQALGKETKDLGLIDPSTRPPIRPFNAFCDASSPELPSTVGKAVSGLLDATGRLTQTELADLADVSARSIRDNRELLEAVSLLDVTEDGYRLALSFVDER